MYTPLIVSKLFNLQIQKLCVKYRCSLEGEQASMIYDTSDQRDEVTQFQWPYANHDGDSGIGAKQKTDKLTNCSAHLC